MTGIRSPKRSSSALLPEGQVDSFRKKHVQSTHPNWKASNQSTQTIFTTNKLRCISVPRYGRTSPHPNAEPPTRPHSLSSHLTIRHRGFPSFRAPQQSISTRNKPCHWCLTYTPKPALRPDQTVENSTNNPTSCGSFGSRLPICPWECQDDHSPAWHQDKLCCGLFEALSEAHPAKSDGDPHPGMISENTNLMIK
jgi:hypothetical protein